MLTLEICGIGTGSKCDLFPAEQLLSYEIYLIPHQEHAAEEVELGFGLVVLET
jgi:hypothetical protein